MKYIPSPRTDPRWNLALEQYVFDSLDRSQSYFLLWQNRDTIVAGKNQNIAAEIDPAFVRERGITVVRRLSGGGAVYHDMGNLNFTFITDSGALEKINFQMFCRPIVETLASYGVEAVLSGRNDITVGGRKFSGNAQYIREGRVMHHGTLMFHTDLTVLERALRVDEEKIKSKGVRSVSSRVTNLREHLPPGVTLEDFKERLLERIARSQPLTPYVLTEADHAAIEAISKSRYAAWEWTFGQSPAYQIRHRQRVEGCGLVEVSMDVKNGAIAAIGFSGDFFGSGELSQLETALRGCPCRREAVESVLNGLDVGLYIHNLTPARLAAIIVP